MATVVAATVTGTAATITLLNVGYKKCKSIQWLFDRNWQVNTSSWEDLKNLEKFIAFLVLMENQFNSLDDYNPAYAVANIFLSHFYFTFAYLIDLRFEKDETFYAESQAEHLEAQRERERERNGDGNGNEQKKRPASYQRPKRKESKLEKSVKSNSRDAVRTLSRKASKMGTKLKSSLRGSAIPKTGNLSAVLKENNIADIETARTIVHTNWKGYDVIGLSTNTFQLRSRFWLLSECLKEAGHESALRVNEFLKGFAVDPKPKMKDYPVELNNADRTLRRKGEKKTLTEFQGAWKSFQQLIECHNEVVATEYVGFNTRGIKEASVNSLVPYIRAMTRKQYDIFPMIHVQKSVDAHVLGGELKQRKGAKGTNPEEKMSKTGLMLLSESEGPEVFWEQCLLVFNINSKVKFNKEVFLRQVYSLDNALHVFTKEGKRAELLDMLQYSYFTNKGNKEWKERYLNRSGEDGNTALHYALKRGYVEIAQELLKAGAKWTTINDADETPFDIANRSKLVGQLYKDPAVPKYDGVPSRDKV